MVKQYETVVILTPVLSDADALRMMKKYVALLKDKGAEIVHEDFWGLKHLAYPIQKKTSGIYFLVEFKCEGSAVDVLELQYRRDPEVLRFLTVHLDKHAVKYNDEKRRGLISKYKADRVAQKAVRDNEKSTRVTSIYEDDLDLEKDL
jgi:small subunit ribosomal protein S6